MMPTGPIRVLHAVPDLLYGGLQRLVLQLEQLTDKNRFDVQILVFGPIGDLVSPTQRGARIHRVGPQSRLSMIWPRALTAQIRQLSPDVVHTHSGVWYKTSLAARRAGVPWLIHTDHGRMVPDPWQARLVDHLASRKTDLIAAVSEPLAERLRRSVVADPNRVRVVTNGVDTDAIRPGTASNLRSELGIPAEALVVGSVGRLEPIKGYDVMVESFAPLADRMPNSYLVVAGDGADRGQLEARTRALGLENRVRWLGWRKDLMEVLATLDLFVLTSRSEGTSVSILEAMSAGVCPVVTNVGGNADVLGPGLHHRLVPSENPEAIARGWAAALGDPEASRRDAATARQRVIESFSLLAMVRRYEEIYEEGLAAASTEATSRLI